VAAGGTIIAGRAERGTRRKETAWTTEGTEAKRATLTATTPSSTTTATAPRTTQSRIVAESVIDEGDRPARDVQTTAVPRSTVPASTAGTTVTTVATTTPVAAIATRSTRKGAGVTGGTISSLTSNTTSSTSAAGPTGSATTTVTSAGAVSSLGGIGAEGVGGEGDYPSAHIQTTTVPARACTTHAPFRSRTAIPTIPAGCASFPAAAGVDGTMDDTTVAGKARAPTATTTTRSSRASKTSEPSRTPDGAIGLDRGIGHREGSPRDEQTSTGARTPGAAIAT
jgi:hypothetical protein